MNEEYNAALGALVHQFGGPVPVAECMRLAARMNATGRFYVAYGEEWCEFTFADNSTVTIGITDQM